MCDIVFCTFSYIYIYQKVQKTMSHMSHTHSKKLKLERITSVYEFLIPFLNSIARYVVVMPRPSKTLIITALSF